MLRWLYIRLLWAHPAEFRRRFGDEMLEAFDLSAGSQTTVRLLADGLLSLARQWVLRSEFRQPAVASPPDYEVITFHQIEPYKPRGIALTQGGLAAIVLLIGIVTAINYGGGHPRSLPIGMQRPGLGLIKINRSDLEGQPAVAAQAAKDEDDPLRPFARSYFHILHVLAALDADGDLTISADEIANAPAVLRTLERNHQLRYGRDLMSTNPVLAALDTNHDGRISAEEIANSPAALLTLDLDHNGSLSPYEILPHPAVSHAAGIIGRFDISDSGVIAIESLPKEDPDIDAIKRLLVAADRNHDGLVTRGELVIELASHPDREAKP